MAVPADRTAPEEHASQPANLALYRKYRPATFAEVRGQEHVTAPLRQALKSGRINHAYLFSGPRGVGKRTFAVELAKALLCEASPPGVLEPCDRCPACVQVEAGTHPDYSLAARPPEAQDFPIEQMREICQSFALKSARGRGRVVILDDADDLNEAAANCFLKTLEEPPPRSVGSGFQRQPRQGAGHGRPSHVGFPPCTLGGARP